MMANPDHLELITQSVEQWNIWRESYPEEVPDLSGANLYGAIPDRDIFSRANFSRANFSHASLCRTDLRESNFSGVDLSRAMCTDAVFTRVNFINANLTSAYLAGAHFYKADLTNAALSGATLAGATLPHAILAGADLTDASLTDADLTTPTLVMGNVYGHYPLEQNPCQLTCITQNTLQPNMEPKATLQRSNMKDAHWVPHVPFVKITLVGAIKTIVNAALTRLASLT